MLDAGTADVLAVWKLDRFSRMGLSAVADLIEVLDKNVTRKPSTIEEGRQHAARIIEQSERVATTIRQLLDFARRRWGHSAKRPTSMTWRGALSSCCDPSRAKKTSHLTLQPSDVRAVAVDSTQIEQAMGNLIMNAVHAIRDQGEYRDFKWS